MQAVRVPHAPARGLHVLCLSSLKHQHGSVGLPWALRVDQGWCWGHLALALPPPCLAEGGTQDILPSISSALKQTASRGMMNSQVFIELERARVYVLNRLTALSSMDSREGLCPPLPSAGPSGAGSWSCLTCHPPCGPLQCVSSLRRAWLQPRPPAQGLLTRLQSFADDPCAGPCILKRRL